MNLSEEDIDKSKVPPLHQKRILAFINHFLISSCSFLNDFASKCESRFIKLERKLQKVEAALTIIEAKLASIPDAEGIAVTSTDATKVNEPPAGEDTKLNTDDINPQSTIEDTVDGVTEDSSIEPLVVGVRACEDIRYKKFFKMVQFGVPAGAVKMKMKAEGMNADILDTPNQILPDGSAS